MVEFEDMWIVLEICGAFRRMVERLGEFWSIHESFRGFVRVYQGLGEFSSFLSSFKASVVLERLVEFGIVWKSLGAICRLWSVWESF